MGLDIYLYKCKDLEKSKKLTDAYEKESTKIWTANGKKYDELSREEKDDIKKKCAEAAKKLGLNEGGEDLSDIKVELPSKKYPDHYFKIGYFRSSYNDSGINRILDTAIGKNLYTLFEREQEDDYQFKPDWEKVKKNCLDAIDKFKAHLGEIGNVSVFKIMHESFADDTINSEKQALDIFKEQLKTHKDHSGDGAFGNKYGLFTLKEPYKVKAIIPGVCNFLDKNRPCVYVAIENEGLDWYLNALEIIVETIDYILAQEDRQDYYLCWSS